ncbi:MAG TPA: methyltransferase [Ktedonobacterales bacterium]|nr:methyltransferase [Ktedonobacterales bacterium]
MSAQDVPPQMAMLRMLNGFHVTQMLAVAARLGVADLLGDGPQSAEALASAIGAHPDALYRLMRALANMGVFEALPERRFALTPLGATLRADHPDRMRAFAMFLGEEVYRAWGDLYYTITTDQPAFDHIFGAHHFDYLATHPASNELFNQAMSAAARREIVAMVAAYDFSEVERVVDVGGGHGLLLSAILQENPGLHGVLFDLPHVVANAGPMLGAAGVADRCEVVGGDFFTGTPPAGDILTLSHIIHDWDDAHCIQILRSCTRALRTGGKLLVVEDVIEPGANAPQTLFRDMQMMVLNGGRERTAAEFEGLFTAADLRMTRIIPTQATTHIIEGVTAP